MDRFMKRDLRHARRAYEAFVEAFPEARLKMYWEPLSDEFLIATDDPKLFFSDRYSELRHKFDEGLFKKTYYPVVFACVPLGDAKEELEVNNFSNNSNNNANTTSGAEKKASFKDSAKTRL